MGATTEDRGSLHLCQLGGAQYYFRTPRIYDPPKIHRVLLQQRVRTPSAMEFLVAGKEGVREMAKLAGDPEEGERQAELLDQWADVTKPIHEDDLDEPDPVERAKLLASKKAEQGKAMEALFPDMLAIRANLERHHPPYAELRADERYWQDISGIEVVRLLLARIGDRTVERDEDGFMTEQAYQTLPRKHRGELAQFGFGLLSPTELERKN